MKVSKKAIELDQDVKRVFSLLLKNLKQAHEMLDFVDEVFSDKEVFKLNPTFTVYFTALHFEFTNTIKKAEALNKHENVDTLIKDEYFKALCGSQLKQLHINIKDFRKEIKKTGKSVEEHARISLFAREYNRALGEKNEDQ